MQTLKMNVPCVSLIITSYNRAGVVGRAIDSALNQTYPNLDIIVVDDGSTDDTVHVLQRFPDHRVRIIRHERNRGATAAKNTGLNAIKGEWFGFVDSDDEIVPDAIETLMRIPLEIDPKVNHVNCNCIDSRTGEFSGHGIAETQYLGESPKLWHVTGELWGIIKSELLQGDRFNENVPGREDILWFKIGERSKRYYIHEGLRIYHTEGDDRITKEFRSTEKEASFHQILLGETHWLTNYAEFNPQAYRKFCFRGLIYTLAVSDYRSADVYLSLIMEMPGDTAIKSLSRVIRMSGILGAQVAVKLLNSRRVVASLLGR